MKAYVDELPKNCWQCIFSDNQKGYCDLLETRILRQFTRRAIGCPLKSLADHDKQVRKEVCDEIKKQVIQSTCYDTEEEVRNVIYDLNASSVLEILDQLQGENNGIKINDDTRNN